MKRFLITALCLCLAFQLFSQKQLILIKRGQVVARFTEGEYLRVVLKKKHRHAEGHIIELMDFSMITSNDTIQFKDILKVNIKRHRGSIGTAAKFGRVLFMGGIVFLAVDELNALIGVHSADLSNEEIFIPLGISAVGALSFIRSKYRRINGIQYLQTIDYRSPFYHR